MSLFLCSSGSNVRGESRALEGYRDSSKSPSTVQNGEELLGGTEERGKKFPRRGVIDLPTRQINIFFLSGLTDISLLVTTLDYIRILIIKKNKVNSFDKSCQKLSRYFLSSSVSPKQLANIRPQVNILLYGERLPEPSGEGEPVFVWPL